MGYKESFGPLTSYMERWIVGTYYVCQTALVIGFGDMITLKADEIYLLIMMMFVGKPCRSFPTLALTLCTSFGMTLVKFQGFLFLRVIISDMTAAAVDSDEIRAMFSERMKCLQTVLHREGVNAKLVRYHKSSTNLAPERKELPGVHLRRNCIEHMKHTWVLSKGLQPQELLGDLHPSLEADLFREYIGDAVSKVNEFCNVVISRRSTLS